MIRKLKMERRWHTNRNRRLQTSLFLQEWSVWSRWSMTNSCIDEKQWKCWLAKYPRRSMTVPNRLAIDHQHLDRPEAIEIEPFPSSKRRFHCRVKLKKEHYFTHQQTVHESWSRKIILNFKKNQNIFPRPQTLIPLESAPKNSPWFRPREGAWIGYSFTNCSQKHPTINRFFPLDFASVSKWDKPPSDESYSAGSSRRGNSKKGFTTSFRISLFETNGSPRWRCCK